MKWWTEKAALINDREPRERLIIAMLVLAMIWSAFNFIFLMPLEQSKANLEMRMDKAQQDLKKLSAQELVLAKALTNDPNAVKKKEIDRLEQELKGLEKNLQALSVGLIPADELPLALHDVLESVGDLKLVGMETLAPSRLQLNQAEQEAPLVDEQTEGAEGEEVAENADVAAEELEDETVGIFKHSVVVELEGQYFDVVAYLSALENLKWKFYWQGIDYEVEHYPKAKVVIEVYTLSTEQGVLGV